jgi:hypothetical protein
MCAHHVHPSLNVFPCICTCMCSVGYVVRMSVYVHVCVYTSVSVCVCAHPWLNCCLFTHQPDCSESGFGGSAASASVDFDHVRSPTRRMWTQSSTCRHRLARQSRRRAPRMRLGPMKQHWYMDCVCSRMWICAPAYVCGCLCVSTNKLLFWCVFLICFEKLSQ